MNWHTDSIFSFTKVRNNAMNYVLIQITYGNKEIYQYLESGDIRIASPYNYYY